MVTEEFPVCVPFRSDNGGVRDDLWTFTRDWWINSFSGSIIFTGDAHPDVEDGLFRRAWAINSAVHAARETFPEADVVVVADADTIMVDPQDVLTAMDMARRSRGLVFTHEQRYMLGPQDTAHVLSHGSMNGDPETTGPHPNTYSGIFAIHTELWDRVGGFDWRFEGWGYEDWGFMWACSTLGTMMRAPGECLHLWHPRKVEDEAGQPHYKDNEALFYRYQAASWQPDLMSALLGEARR